MPSIIVAAAALNQTPLDWDGNRLNIEQAISNARKKGVKILCLPELCITGYGCEDRFFSRDLRARALAVLKHLMPLTSGMTVSFGLPLEVKGEIYNAAALISDKKLLGFALKQNLAGEGIYYEPRWFKAWPSGEKTKLKFFGKIVPVGDLIFKAEGVKIGFEICEDAWVSERVGVSLHKRKVDLILNPSASHFSFDKHKVRKNLVVDGSKRFNCAYVYTNLLGCDSGRIIYDGDCLIAHSGDLINRSTRLSFKNVDLVTGNINFSGRSEKHYRSVNWQNSNCLKEEEFTRAVMLGLFDYMRRSKSSGFVVSLSGGVDSSAASCLVTLMIHYAVQELGWTEFRQRLSYIPGSQSWKNTKEVTKALLTCVYQKSANSSKVTEAAARSVATEIGATFLNFKISNFVSDYVAMVSKGLKRKLTWERDGLALQNIQARVRSPGVWLIANLKSALLLSTSNRSEAAVGYTTMDGDTSGGLSPLGGIDKAFLRKWLVWLEKEGPQNGQNFKSLRFVNRQQPTAELKPLKDKQTDEGDLMPYVVLDRIERFAIRDSLAPKEVFASVKKEFRGKYPQVKLLFWTKKFFQLWSRNQWKRERYAPSFHLDDESLDPKTWCRFPILSGGFEKELSELK